MIKKSLFSPFSILWFKLNFNKAVNRFVVVIGQYFNKLRYKFFNFHGDKLEKKINLRSINNANLMYQDQNNHFFILEEKDGTFSAVIKFGGHETKDDAQFVIDAILVELGLQRLPISKQNTIH